jgi:KaiC/GvpD/RAD55 family RecA-like ATPase
MFLFSLPKGITGLDEQIRGGNGRGGLTLAAGLAVTYA